jgi:hypothetical protein
MSILDSLKKLAKGLKKPHIRFKCHTGGYYTSQPVVLARSILPYWLKKQIQAKEVKFVRCPGMHDLAQQGYLIVAHADIHIKANRQVTLVDVHGIPDSLKPQPMGYDVVDGLAPIRGNVAKKVTKIPLPWCIFTAPGYSAHVLPAVKHSPFLDKLFVYGGEVDYEGFHVVNFIFTAMEECEFTIPAGTPLLQVIPFKREDFHAEVGKATELEHDQHRFAFTSRVVGAYRRMYHVKKLFTIRNQNERAFPRKQS